MYKGVCSFGIKIPRNTSALSVLFIYYPNNELVKKANRFEVPDGSDPNQNRVPPIAMIDDVNKNVSATYKQQRLTAAYEALYRKDLISQIIYYRQRMR